MKNCAELKTMYKTNEKNYIIINIKLIIFANNN